MYEFNIIGCIDRHILLFSHALDAMSANCWPVCDGVRQVRISTWKWLQLFDRLFGEAVPKLKAEPQRCGEQYTGRNIGPNCLQDFIVLKIIVHTCFLGFQLPFLNCWIQAVKAVMLATRGRGRFSAHLLKHAILDFYEKHKLWPKGIVRSMSCIEQWSLKMGRALQRLAFWQQFA